MLCFARFPLLSQSEPHLVDTIRLHCWLHPRCGVAVSDIQGIHLRRFFEELRLVALDEKVGVSKFEITSDNMDNMDNTRRQECVYEAHSTIRLQSVQWHDKQ